MKTTIKLSLVIFALICGNALKAQTTTATLNVNNVRATVASDGVLFFDGYNSSNGYEVPMYSGKQAIKRAGIWVGGYDQNGQLHISASTDRQHGADFNYGAMDTVNMICTNSANNNYYNQIFNVDCHEIDTFLNYDYISSSIMNWPGNGNIANKEGQFLAPFIDVDGDGVYSPAAGDYPKIKGDRTYFWVYNDACGTHTETNGSPIGIEVRVMAYAYKGGNSNDTLKALANTTFYHYEIINRSSYPYTNSMFSFFVDADLGNKNDDRIGSDVLSNFSYVYNDQPADSIYGASNMVLSLMQLKGPYADPGDGINNDRDSIYNSNGIALGPDIDEPGEECFFSNTMYYNENNPALPPATTDPVTAQEYFNYMNNRWKDSSALYPQGTGYSPGSNSTAYHAFPFNPQITGGSNWTEISEGISAGNRKMLLTTGPVTLSAGETNELEFAITYSSDPAMNWNDTSIRQTAKKDVDIIQYLYRTNKFPSCAGLTGIGINESQKKNSLTVYPNPTSDFLFIKSEKAVNKNIIAVIYDVNGRTVMNEKLNSVEGKINISKIASGVYSLFLISDETIYTARFVKE